MKIEIYLKDPDGFYDAIVEASEESVAHLRLPHNEAEVLAESRKEAAYEAIKKWVEYGECVTIIFDTEAMTATVKEICR